MSRAARLLALIQALRRHRRPVGRRELAEEMSVSLRTLYRDIQTLMDQGAPRSLALTSETAQKVTPDWVHTIRL